MQDDSLMAAPERETIEPWTRLQYVRWGFPQPSPAEMAVSLELGRRDVDGMHQ